MEDFLNETNERLKSSTFSDATLILGNESCDLDSAVSALVYGHYLHWQHNRIKCKVCTRNKRDPETYMDEIFVPILNVARDDFDIKTEIVYVLNESGIDARKLFFRDDLNLQDLTTKEKTNVILVDHHVLSKNDAFLAPYVTEILDHRPLDKTSWTYRDDTRSFIEMVGSCCTLVCDRIRNLSGLLNKGDYFEGNTVIANLLHSTIILDTVNFSPDVKKGTPKDEEMVVFLESIINPTSVDEFRSCELETLVAARKDISKLTVGQLLKKDVKIFGDVLVPSFPILVQELIQKPNFETDLKSALDKTGCKLALLLGMKLSQDAVERDAAIYCIEESKGRGEQLKRILQDWTTPNLELSPCTSPVPNCYLYRQLNKSASRKQFVPAVNTFLNK